jgi:hypothetical protein
MIVSIGLTLPLAETARAAPLGFRRRTTDERGLESNLLFFGVWSYKRPKEFLGFH